MVVNYKRFEYLTEKDIFNVRRKIYGDSKLLLFFEVAIQTGRSWKEISKLRSFTLESCLQDVTLELFFAIKNNQIENCPWVFPKQSNSQEPMPYHSFLRWIYSELEKYRMRLTPQITRNTFILLKTRKRMEEEFGINLNQEKTFQLLKIVNTI